jgi:hypothetical protein
MCVTDRKLRYTQENTIIFCRAHIFLSEIFLTHKNIKGENPTRQNLLPFPPAQTSGAKPKPKSRLSAPKEKR